MSKNFIKRLDEALVSYRETIELIDRLLKEKENAQEIVLLACARLDSLANLINKNRSLGQKQAFTQMLLNYSGEKKFFNSISVGELYKYLFFYGEIVEELMIEKPGRITRFSPDDINYLEFIEKSRIPIVGKKVRQFTNRITRILEKNFRVKAGQSTKKSHIATVENIRKIIYSEFKSIEPKLVFNSMESLLNSAKISSIFYEDFRCQVIHGFIVPIDDEKFFKSAEPYHSLIYYLYGDIFHIQFSAKYLRNLLEKVLNTFTHQIIKKKKIPFDLYNVMYDYDEMMEMKGEEFIDDDDYSESEDVKWLIKKR